MKRNRVICLAIVIVMALMLFVGCAEKTDWENVSKSTVIANVDGYEVDMDLIKYFYAEQIAADEIGAMLSGSMADFFGEEALSEQSEEVAYDNCIDIVLAYAALERVAVNKNLAEIYDNAREKAYEELILSTKNSASGYEYFAQYTEKIKSNYTATDDALCDIAGELYMLRDSAENLINDYYNKGSYESKDDAIKDITSKLKEEIKDIDAKILYPSEKKADIKIDSIVENFLSLK